MGGLPDTGFDFEFGASVLCVLIGCTGRAGLAVGLLFLSMPLLPRKSSSALRLCDMAGGCTASRGEAPSPLMEARRSEIY